MARRKRKSIGEDFGNRLSGRSDLRSQSVGNGEVFRGSLADKALQAVNARAMTVEGEIIVNGNFDPSKPEDQALFAHEKFHQEQSGGVAGHSGRDAEEIAARAIESMVFHEAQKTGKNAIPQNSTEFLSKIKELETKHHNNEAVNTEDPLKPYEPSPLRGYHALLKQGYTHQQIVLECVHRMVSEYDRMSIELDDRSASSKGFLS